MVTTDPRMRRESIFAEEIDRLGDDSSMTRSSPDTTRVDLAESDLKKKKQKKYSYPI